MYMIGLKWIHGMTRWSKIGLNLPNDHLYLIGDFLPLVLVCVLVDEGGEEFKIPMFKIPTFIIPMVQNTNEALSKYHLKVHNTNKLKRVKFLQFKIPTGWYYEHSVHNTNYNCCHGWVSPITLIYAQWLHIRRGRVMWGKWAKLTCCMMALLQTIERCTYIANIVPNVKSCHAYTVVTSYRRTQ